MKKLLCISAALLLMLVLAVPALAATDHVIDDADLLTPSQEQQLEEKLAAVSENLGMDIVVATTNNTGYKSTGAYADDLYDYSGYGDDGALYLIDMDNRQMWISTAGKAIDSLSDSDIDDMLDEMFSYVSSEDYFGSAMCFARLCEEYAGMDWGMTLLICFGAGLIIAFIATGVMKKQLNNVQLKAGAWDYMKQGSLNITESRDLFLYRNISRTAKPKNNGSSSHRSSSGRSHGGGGRSF